MCSIQADRLTGFHFLRTIAVIPYFTKSLTQTLANPNTKSNPNFNCKPNRSPNANPIPGIWQNGKTRVAVPVCTARKQQNTEKTPE